MGSESLCPVLLYPLSFPLLTHRLKVLRRNPLISLHDLMEHNVPFALESRVCAQLNDYFCLCNTLAFNNNVFAI